MRRSSLNSYFSAINTFFVPPPLKAPSGNVCFYAVEFWLVNQPVGWVDGWFVKEGIQPASGVLFYLIHNKRTFHAVVGLLGLTFILIVVLQRYIVHVYECT